MSNYGLFSVIGIEIEYMLVDKKTLAVQPKSDKVIHALAGKITNETVLGDIGLSNELVMHVIELKNSQPKPLSAPLVSEFQGAIMALQPLLDEHELMLLPTGAHPWMEPDKETVRWPYDNQAIYQQFDTIFNCRGHGWSNLQSMHVNLPFANDHEFNELHNAIRLILPLLPALAASTPFLEGRLTGMQDSRLNFYGTNQQRIPLISGTIIPDFISSKQAYQQTILLPMYQAIKPFDPDNLLQFEWLNSRAAIPKFNYNAIEIRILDSQECVLADIAIARVIIAILKYWQQQPAVYLMRPCETGRLKALYDQTRQQGLSVEVDDSVLMKQWQLSTSTRSCREVWSQLIEKVSTELDDCTQLALEHILRFGNLSERIVNACAQRHDRETLTQVYRKLGQCLLANRLFTP